jgi:hypothetical protein
MSSKVQLAGPLPAHGSAPPPGPAAYSVSADIKALTLDEPSLLTSAAPAFEKYNEEQLTTVKLPGASQQVRKAASLTQRQPALTDFAGGRQQVQLAGRRPVLRRGERELVCL